MFEFEFEGNRFRFEYSDDEEVKVTLLGSGVEAWDVVRARNHAEEVAEGFAGYYPFESSRMRDISDALGGDHEYSPPKQPHVPGRVY